MGIKDFYKHLKTKFPECFVPVHYSVFRHQKIAIDMMNLLYIYKARSDKDWMTLVIEFMIHLREYYVHPVCVFDGQSHPLKQDTVQKRRTEREKGRNRLDQLRSDIQVFKENGTINENFRVFLGAHEDFVSKLTQQPLLARIHEHIDRQYKNYSIHFRSTEIEALKEILSAMGLCVLTADHDGEALCSYLSSTEQIDVVLSNDSDVFFFGCKKVMFKFTEEGGYLLHLNQVLTKLNLTVDQFTDLCLLCGTDFNVPVKGIGFCRAYAMIQQFQSIKNTTLPLYSQLNHDQLDEIRQMAVPKNGFDQPVHFTRPVNATRLSELLFHHHIPLALDRFVWPTVPIELE